LRGILGLNHVLFSQVLLRQGLAAFDASGMHTFKTTSNSDVLLDVDNGRTGTLRDKEMLGLERHSVEDACHRQIEGAVIVKLMIRVVGLSLAVWLSGTALARSQEMRDGQALLTAMHDRYKDAWYDSVVFKQNSVTLNPDGTSKTEIWDEALQLPGELRIDREPHSAGNGYVFADGTLTAFENGKSSGTRPFVHMLLVLGFDVYRQPAEKTIALTKDRGIDLTQIHEETWDGEPVYVVGAAKGDLKSKQFWVEKKRLLFVKLIEPDEKDAAQIHESRFRNYKKIAGGWISERVEFYTDGKNIFYEEYFDVKGNVKLDPALFDPSKFSETSVFK